MSGGRILGMSHMLGVVVLLAVLALLFIHRAVKGPLAHLPGPAISKWTNWRLKIAVLKGDRVRYVHALHQKYGPIVRITPKEISVADLAATKTVYKVGGPYLKTEWYDVFTGSGRAKGLFAEADFYKHGQHRRLTSSNFSEKWVAQMEPHISSNVRLAIQRMAEEMDARQFCDVFKWFLFMASDVIGEASFGESFHMLETGKKNQYIEDLQRVGNLGSKRAEFPLLVSLMRRLRNKRAMEMVEIVNRLNRYAGESVDRYWKQLNADPDNVKPTLLTKEYAAVENGTITKDQMEVDARGNIVAGTDTTAITATNAVHLLAHHPDVEQALIEEVSTLPEGFVDEDLRSLPLLSNVVHETLRLAGPVGQGLPRYVPKGGATFCGYPIPGGIVVGVQAYTMHRDPEVWPNPEQFDPSRWNNPTTEMKQTFLPFGGGSRICIGMHFAQLELRHALANFYRTFARGVKMAYVEGFTEDDMLPMGFFLSPPKGHRCLVEVR